MSNIFLAADVVSTFLNMYGGSFVGCVSGSVHWIIMIVDRTPNVDGCSVAISLLVLVPSLS